LGKRRRRIKRFFLLFFPGVFLLTGAFIYLFFYTSFFTFRYINISGLTGLTREDLFHPGKRVSLFENISISNPQIASFVVSKDIFSRTLSVAVHERRPYAIWCETAESSTNCLWFDEVGVLFARAPATEGSLLNSVYDGSGRNLSTGDKVLDDDSILNMMKIFETTDLAGVEVSKFRLEPLEKEELTAITKGGAEIHFSLRLDPGFAIEPLKVLKDQLGSLRYIDLRSENRVFYK